MQVQTGTMIRRRSRRPGDIDQIPVLHRNNIPVIGSRHIKHIGSECKIRRRDLRITSLHLNNIFHFCQCFSVSDQIHCSLCPESVCRFASHLQRHPGKCHTLLHQGVGTRIAFKDSEGFCNLQIHPDISADRCTAIGDRTLNTNAKPPAEFDQFSRKYSSLRFIRNLCSGTNRNVNDTGVRSHRHLFCHDTCKHLAACIDLQRVFIRDDHVIGGGDVGRSSPDDYAAGFQGHLLNFLYCECDRGKCFHQIGGSACTGNGTGAGFRDEKTGCCDDRYDEEGNFVSRHSADGVFIYNRPGVEGQPVTGCYHFAGEGFYFIHVKAVDVGCGDVGGDLGGREDFFGHVFHDLGGFFTG